MFLILLTNMLVGFVFTLVKELLEYMPPFLFLAFRTLIGGSFFAGLFFYFKGYYSYKIDYRTIIFFCLIAFVYIYLSNYFLYDSFKSLSSTQVMLIYNFNPFIVALLSYFIFKESFNLKKISGLVIGWIGFAFLLFVNSMKDTYNSQFLIGALMALGAALCTALGFIAFQKILYKNTVPYTVLNAVMFVFAGVCALATSVVVERGSFSNTTLSFNSYALVLFLVITILSIFWMYFNTILFSRYSATFLSLTGFSIPIFGAFFEWMLFNRSVSLSFYVALVFVGIGLLLFYQADKSNHK